MTRPPVHGGARSRAVLFTLLTVLFLLFAFAAGRAHQYVVMFAALALAAWLADGARRSAALGRSNRRA